MSAKTTIIQNFKNPVVLVVGGVIGLIIIMKNKGSVSGVDPNYTQSMVAVHDSDNQLKAQQMAIQAQVDQKRIDSDNQRFLVSAGINADVTKTGLQSQTMIALAGEQTKQLIGLGTIQANRDVTINLQNTERDKFVVADTNRTSVTNTQTMTNGSIQVANMALQQTLSNNALGLKALDVTQSQIASNERLQANLAAANFTLASKQKNFSGGLGSGGVIAGGSQGSNSGGGFSSILNSIGGLARSVTPILGMFA